MKKNVVLLILISLLLTGKAWGITVYVDASNNTGVEDGTPGLPYDTIQEAIDVALSGDTVSVAPGIYHGALTLKDQVKVISEQGPKVTYIDGMSASQAIRQPYTLVANSYIEGFTISGSSTLVYVTNRVSFWSSSSMEIHNCILKDASWAVNIYPSARVTLTRSLIYFVGTAIDGIWCPAPQIKNVTVDFAQRGVNLYQAYAYLYNTTFTKTTNVFSTWGRRGYARIYGSHNNFFNYTNFLAPGSNGQLPYFGATNSLYVNPYFVAEIPHGADYSLTENSPLIDAGVDVGLPFAGAAPDIGAYEANYVINIPEAVGELAESYQETPVETFKNSGEQRRHAMDNKIKALLKKLDAITDDTTDDEKLAIYYDSLDKLMNDIWAKADGFYGGNPKNDWIVTQEEQDRLYPKVMEIKEAIESEINNLTTPTP